MNTTHIEAEESPAIVTVKAVSEASGIPATEVRKHLKQIRAETAFAPAQKFYYVPLTLVAGIMVAVVGVTATLKRMGKLPSATPALSSTNTNLVFSTSISNTPRSLLTRSTPLNNLTAAGEELPSGFRVGVQSNSESLESTGKSTGRWPGRAKLFKELVDSWLANEHYRLKYHISKSNKNTVNDPLGISYTLSSNQVVIYASYLTFGGFSRLLTSNGSNPGAFKRELESAANDYLNEATYSQTESLRRVPWRQDAVVSPPAGFSTIVGGRRIDFQRGPRIKLSPLNVSAVSQRLEASILNALYRDGIPPVEGWSGAIGKDGAIPQPDKTRIQIIGPQGAMTFDVTTKSLGRGQNFKLQSEARETIHKEAVQLANQVINYEKDATPDHH